jgi:6-pyruvoyltetrahydropterin 2'-reductase
MAKIRYSEIFYSFQGEAELAGKPSVWIRFFGCNLECNGFGQQDPTNPETYILPYQTFDVQSVKKIEDLPVWNYGCDSSYSWSTKYKHLVKDATASEIADLIIDQMRHVSNPEGLFTHPDTGQDTQLCFTGGEPMMWQKAMADIIRELKLRHNVPRTVTVETNATKKISEDLKTFINEEFVEEGGGRWHWAMSPKLWSVAGEKDAVDAELILDYCSNTYSTAILKFVCNGTEQCWEEVTAHTNTIQRLFGEESFYPPDIWIMPVGATKDQQEDAQVAMIAMEAMKRGYQVATRNHCYVFGNVIGK